MNFLREVEILIGPLAEGKKGNPAQALRLFSNGSPEGLRVSFRVQKSIISVPNFSSIVIYNLSEDTRALLNTSKMQITVNAGWSNSGKLPLVFSGGILNSFSERQGPDIITRVNALTMGDTLSRTIGRFTFKSGMQIVDCLLKIMSIADGVKVDSSAIKIDNNKIDKGGISFAGQVKDLLDMMGRQYGFSWSIQDGIFQAVGDNVSLDGTPTILNGKDGSLISCNPLLAGPMQITRGVRIRSVLQPGLSVGKVVTVVNSANTGLDNDYKIHLMDITGDTYNNEWFVDIQSLFTF